MNHMSKRERERIQIVKKYLERYVPAEENRKNVSQIRNDDEYVAEQVLRAQTIKKEVVNAISLLEVSRDKTLLELRYICGFDWLKIYRQLNISKSTGVVIHSRAMLKLYDKMIENKIIDSDTKT